MAKRKAIHVTAYPYAVTYGVIKVPVDVKDVKQYLIDHWTEIKFGNPDLDYAGIDFEYNEE